MGDVFKVDVEALKRAGKSVAEQATTLSSSHRASMVSLSDSESGWVGSSADALVGMANKWQQIVHITVPMLAPVLFFVVTYSLISAMQVFDKPWLLTGSSFTSYGGRRNALLFPVMLYAGPSGLNLYILTSTSFGIIPAPGDARVPNGRSPLMAKTSAPAAMNTPPAI